MQKVSFTKRMMRSKAIPLLIVLIVLVLVTMLISSGVLEGAPLSDILTEGFLAKGNLINIFFGLVIRCILMCGISLVLIGGNIDLSVSGQAALGAMIFALICRDLPGLPWGFSLIIVLLLGAVFGLINTFLVGKLNFPPFIATIGMASVYRGLCNVITQGNNIQLSRASLIETAQIKLFDRFPVTFVLALVFIVVYSFILSKTTLGRSIFMVGGNRQAARLSGLNTNRIRMFLFINSGMLAVLGGFLWSSQVRLASPTAIIASDPGISVISASILGGVSFGGGAGSLGGPLVALLLLNVFDNMLMVLGVQPYWNVFARGLLLVVALIIDYVNEERRRKALLVAASGN